MIEIDQRLVAREAVGDRRSTVVAELVSKNAAGNDFGGQSSHFVQGVDLRAVRHPVPALDQFGGRALHHRTEGRHSFGMHDVGDQGTPLFPGFAVRDEEAVAQKELERPAHLRALALEVLMTLDDDLTDEVGRVDQNDLPADQPDLGNLLGKVVVSPDG